MCKLFKAVYDLQDKMYDMVVSMKVNFDSLAGSGLSKYKNYDIIETNVEFWEGGNENTTLA